MAGRRRKTIFDLWVSRYPVRILPWAKFLVINLKPLTRQSGFLLPFQSKCFVYHSPTNVEWNDQSNEQNHVNPAPQHVIGQTWSRYRPGIHNGQLTILGTRSVENSFVLHPVITGSTENMILACSIQEVLLPFGNFKPHVFLTLNLSEMNLGGGALYLLQKRYRLISYQVL